MLSLQWFSSSFHSEKLRVTDLRGRKQARLSPAYMMGTFSSWGPWACPTWDIWRQENQMTIGPLRECSKGEWHPGEALSSLRDSLPGTFNLKSNPEPTQVSLCLRTLRYQNTKGDGSLVYIEAQASSRISLFPELWDPREKMWGRCLFGWLENPRCQQGQGREITWGILREASE